MRIKKTRRRRSAAEAAELVAAFEESGETREAFCRARGLSTSTLDSWRRRARSAKVPREAGLIPVTVVQSMTPSSTYEVELTNGRRVCLPSTFEPKSLERLLSIVDPLC